MPSFVPVEGDPFQQAEPQLVPVEGNPFEQHLGKALASGAEQGAIGIAGAPADIINWAAKKLGHDAPLPNYGSAEWRKWAEEKLGPIYQPQTTAEQYAHSVGAFLPTSMLGPGGFATKLAVNAVVPGLASEAAGQLAKGTDIEPYARVAGGLVGGVGASIAAARGATSKTVAQTSQEIGNVKAAATDVYNALERNTAPVSPSVVQGIPAAISVRPPLSDTTRKIVGELVDNPNPTIADLFATHKSLADIYKGVRTAEWKAAGQAQDAIEALLPELKIADGNYAAAKLAETLRGKNASAELRSSAANSGLNYSNSIKSKLTSWLESRWGQRAPDEVQEAVRQLIEGNVGSNTLRYISNYLGGGGGLGALGTTLSGGVAGALSGGGAVTPIAAGAIAAPLAGLASRQMLNNSTRRQVEGIVRQALETSPYAKAGNLAPLNHPYPGILGALVRPRGLFSSQGGQQSGP
jgi:hypothetical protein